MANGQLENVQPGVAETPRPFREPMQAGILSQEQLDANPFFQKSSEHFAQWNDATDGKFDPITLYAANYDLLNQNQNADLKRRLVDAHKRIAGRNIVEKIKDIDVVQGAKGVVEMGKGLPKDAAGLAENLADLNRKLGLPPVSPVQQTRLFSRMFGEVAEGSSLKDAFMRNVGKEMPDWFLKRISGGEELSKESAQEAKDRLDETAAVLDATGEGLFDMGRRGIRTIGGVTGIGKGWNDLSEQEAFMRFDQDALAIRNAMEAAQGKGTLTKAIGGELDEAQQERVAERIPGSVAGFVALPGALKIGGLTLRGMGEGLARALGSGKITKAAFAAQHLADAQARLAQAERAAAQSGVVARGAQSAATRLGTPEAAAAAETATGRALTEQSIANAARGTAGTALREATAAEQAVGRSFSARHLRSAQQRLPA